jgi:hypothetical protein
MKNMILTLLALAVLFTLGTTGTRAAVDIGLSIDRDGVSSFYLAIGDHYQVKEKDVRVVREQRIPDDELSVVFFIARYAAVAPAAIVKLRLGGRSWMQIVSIYGLSTDIFYVHFDRDPGPPYGNAWGHFKKNKKNKKHGKRNSFQMTDSDIANFVNLKFVCEKYGYTPYEVSKMRARGESFVKIHKQIKAKKGNKPQRSKSMAGSAHPGANGKGKKKHK